MDEREHDVPAPGVPGETPATPPPDDAAGSEPPPPAGGGVRAPTGGGGGDSADDEVYDDSDGAEAPAPWAAGLGGGARDDRDRAPAAPVGSSDAAAAVPARRPPASRRAYGAAALGALAFVGLLCWILNLLVARGYFRYDLTEGELNTLSPVTIEILNKEITDLCYLRFGYQTNAPPEYTRLIGPLRTRLEALQSLAGANDNLRIELHDLTIVDPSDREEVEAVAKRAEQYGIPRVPPQLIADLQRARHTYFGVSVEYRGQTRGISFEQASDVFQQYDRRQSRQRDTAVGIERFEYDLVFAVLQVAQQEKPKLVWLLPSHAVDMDVASSFDRLLSRVIGLYELSFLRDLKNAAKDLENCRALVLFMPSGLTDRDRYEIDQYLMRGGKVVVVTSPWDVRRAGGGINFSMSPKTSGLEELLAHYGVRVRQDLVYESEEHSYQLPVVMFDPAAHALVEVAIPCRFFSVMDRRFLAAGHPASAYLDGVEAYFLSTLEPAPDAQDGRIRTLDFAGGESLESLAGDQIGRLTLARSSPDSWVKEGSYLTVELQAALQEPPPPDTRSRPLVQLLHGRFASYFKDREAPPQPKAEGEEDPLKAEDQADGAAGAEQVLGAETPAAQEAAKRTYSEPATLVVFASEWGYIPRTMQPTLLQNVLITLYDVRLGGIRNKDQRLRPLSYATKDDRFYEFLSLGAVPLALIALGVLNGLRRRGRKSAFLATLERAGGPRAS